MVQLKIATSSDLKEELLSKYLVTKSSFEFSNNFISKFSGRLLIG